MQGADCPSLSTCVESMDAPLKSHAANEGMVRRRATAAWGRFRHREGPTLDTSFSSPTSVAAAGGFGPTTVQSRQFRTEGESMSAGT
jgi:hypothetical protein